MRAVRVLAPAGSSLSVFEVAVEVDGEVLSFLRASDGGEPRTMRGRYSSIAEALSRNSRSITTAELVQVTDIQEARAMARAQETI